MGLQKAEAALLDRLKEVDESGQLVRPLTRSQASELLQKLTSTSSADNQLSALSALVSRKLKLQSGDLRRRLLDVSSSRTHSGPISPLAARTSSSANPQVIDALYSIQTTPYERSFLSRVQGFQPKRTHGVIAVDWETRSPWMELMSDVRQHFALAHPEREQLVETIAPIEYVTLQASHIDQVHDLLGRVFWAGIDVSDSLQYTPEKCTIVATYKQLVVGAAFLSSPQETYITYLAVRAGWENSQIATYVVPCVVYSIKDITLHVSINNPAMLLYNRFGFKAEEFIVGFYEDYLDPQSRASKNAFRLRLRRWASARELTAPVSS
ncbi:hypothetical protein BKA93DRAFT_266924 [Sparassis latifolia]